MSQPPWPSTTQPMNLAFLQLLNLLGLTALLLGPQPLEALELSLGPSDPQTLEALISSAPNSAKILLSPGNYTRGCGARVFNKTIEIVGSSDPKDTVIDCQGLARGLEVSGSQGAEVSLKISGVTIMNGAPNASDPNPDGGCISAKFAGLVLERVVLRGCEVGVEGSGGGVALEDGTLRMKEVEVFESNAGKGGGGVKTLRSSLDLEDVTFDGCYAGDSGGGISVSDSSSGLVGGGSKFEFCSAYNYGGGIHVSSGSSLTLRGSTTLYKGSAYQGGGSFVDQGCVLTAEGAARILENSGFDGGGVHVGPGAVFVAREGTQMKMNKADRYGGGINVNQAWLVALEDDALLAQSSAGSDGGGVAMYSASLEVLGNAELRDNQAGRNGGGIDAVSNCNLVFQGSSKILGGQADSGGGVKLSNGGSLVARGDVHFKGNECDRFGGGIYAESSAYVELEDGVQVSGNNAWLYGGGISLFRSDLVARRGIVFEDNWCRYDGGGIDALTSCTITLSDGVVVRNNFAVDDGGGLDAYDFCSLEASNNVTFEDNGCNDRGGGLYVYQTDVVLSDGVFVTRNTAFQAGGVSIQMPDSQSSYAFVTRRNVVLSDNVAEEDGGGVQFLGPGLNDGNYVGVQFQLSESTIANNVARYGRGGGASLSAANLILADNVVVFNNTAATRGGGFLLNSNCRIFASSGVVFNNNSARFGGAFQSHGSSSGVIRGDVLFQHNYAATDGGAIDLITSELQLGDGVRFLSNTAGDEGGGCFTGLSAHLSVQGVVYENNVAGLGGPVYTGNLAGGGAIFSQAEVVLNVTNSSFLNNHAYNGGALASLGTSEVSSCSFRHNRAVKDGGSFALYDHSKTSISGCSVEDGRANDNGGGLYLEADVECHLTESSFFDCVAGGHGGGVALFNQSSLYVKDELVMSGCVAGDRGGGVHHSGLAFEIEGELMLDGNTAATAGGMSFLSFTKLGTRTTLIRNLATEEGGGAAGLGPSAKLLLSASHKLVIENNTAHKSGGGLALEELARMEFEHEACAAECPFHQIGDGNCNWECFSKNCNWDNGDCDFKFEQAGDHASQPCDRGEQECFHGRQYGGPGCARQCMTAQCDWSKGNPVCNPWIQQIGECPRFDAIAYESLKKADLTFVDNGSVNGYGRCAANATCQVSENRTTPWCPVMDDDGLLIAITCPTCSTTEVVGEAWGDCVAENKPRLPGSGFDYEPSDMLALRDLPTIQLLKDSPGCGYHPVEVRHNTAYENGGGIFRKDCDRELDSKGICFLGHLNTREMPTLMISFDSNIAHGGGAAIFSQCPDLGVCQSILSRSLGIVSDDPFLAFRGNVASAYGNHIATAPRYAHAAMEHMEPLVPGQSALNLTIFFRDSLGQIVSGSQRVPNPHVASVLICDYLMACSTVQSLQAPIFVPARAAEAESVTTDVGAILEWCPVEDMGVVAGVSHFGSDNGAVSTISVSLGCAACQENQQYVERTVAGRRMFTCQSCNPIDEYILSPENRQNPEIKCQKCPAGALEGSECKLRSEITPRSGSRVVVSSSGTTWQVDEERGKFQLVDCPPGSLLINQPEDQQRCVACEPTTYSFNPYDKCDSPRNCKERSCNVCPVGLICAGGDQFTPVLLDSDWEVDSQGVLRLTRCGQGYILVRDDLMPTEQQCVPCPEESYSLQDAVNGSDLVTTRAETAGSRCNKCPQGSSCNGNLIVPASGFWMLPADFQTPSARRSDGGPAVLIYKCGPRACEDGGKCAEGRDPNGILCSVCDENWAKSGNDCKKCSETMSKSDHQVVAAAIAGSLFFLIWVFLLWGPVLPRMRGTKCLTCNCCSCCICCKRTDRKTKSMFLGVRLPILGGKITEALVVQFITDYSKVVLSFGQIVSSFEETFSITWPVGLTSIWEWMSIFRLDLEAIPGASCVAATMTSLELLQTYFWTPLIVAFAMLIPTALLRIIGVHKSNPELFQRFVNRFWICALGWSFLVFPLLSVVSLRGLRCKEVGGVRLYAYDLRQLCPSDDRSTGLFGWTIAAILVYPVAIPAGILIILLVHKVPQMARRMREEVVLKEIIRVYKNSKRQGVEYQIMVAFSIPSDEAAAARRIRTVYDAITGGESAKCNKDGIADFLGSYGVWADEEDIKELINCFDWNSKRYLDFEEFDSMVSKIAATHLQFKHKTKFEELSRKDLMTLCEFDWDTLFKEPTEIEALMATEPGGPSLSNSRGSHVQISPADETLTRFQFSQMMRHVNSLASFRASSSSSRNTTALANCGLMSDCSRAEMCKWILRKGDELVKQGNLVLPVLKWTKESVQGDSEAYILERLGFLFDGYRADYWWFEVWELLRKFMMTGLVSLLYSGSVEQMAVAFVISIVSLALYLRHSPHISEPIAVLQRSALTTQAVILFYGIMLQVRVLQDENDEGAIDNQMMIVLIQGMHLMVFLMPLIWLLVWAFRAAVSRLRDRIAKRREGELDETSELDVSESTHRPSNISSPMLVPLQARAEVGNLKAIASSEPMEETRGVSEKSPPEDGALSRLPLSGVLSDNGWLRGENRVPPETFGTATASDIEVSGRPVGFSGHGAATQVPAMASTQIGQRDANEEFHLSLGHLVRGDSQTTAPSLSLSGPTAPESSSAESETLGASNDSPQNKETVGTA